MGGVSSDCCCNIPFPPLTTCAFAVRISFPTKTGADAQALWMSLI
jgi:hypothetical protein